MREERRGEAELERSGGVGLRLGLSALLGVFLAPFLVSSPCLILGGVGGSMDGWMAWRVVYIHIHDD